MRITERLAARNNNAGNNRPVLIVCLGDSVTHACFELGITEKQWEEPTCRPWEGYAVKLQRKLEKMYPLAAPTVLNAGVGGDAVHQMAERLERDVLSFKPDLVILEVGLNDCMGPDGEDAAEIFGGKVGALMDRIIESGAELLLLTPNAMCAHLHANVPKDSFWRGVFVRAVQKQTEGKMTAFVNAAKEQAAKRGVPVADAYERWEQMRRQGVDTSAMLANQINHPKPEMHDLFVEEIVRTIQAN